MPPIEPAAPIAATERHANTLKPVARLWSSANSELVIWLTAAIIAGVLFGGEPDPTDAIVGWVGGSCQ